MLLTVSLYGNCYLNNSSLCTFGFIAGSSHRC